MRAQRKAPSGLFSWRKARADYFLENPQSPLWGDPDFSGFDHYPERPDLRVEATITPAEGERTVELVTSTGDERTLIVHGTAEFEIGGVPQSLLLFRQEIPGQGVMLFVPFKDATSGVETYGAARYLDIKLDEETWLPAGDGSGAGRLVIDFNYAYHPLCAYTDGYVCPFPPPENNLRVPVRAGERLKGAPRPVGDYLTGPLPVLHGFTTRAGGGSAAPFNSLNLGLSSGDDRELVEANRDLLIAELGFARSAVLAFNQVHGARVLMAPPAGWFLEEADAATTTDPNTLLVVSFADCLPILFYDPTSGAVAAAHAGWRGTVKRIAQSVVTAMEDRYGTEAGNLQVLFGPSIEGSCYQVGQEVTDEFRATGYPEGVAWPDDEPGKYRLDVKAANRWLLEAAGVQPERITEIAGCTHCDPHHYYSHRRDEQRTGRHWAFISSRPQDR